MTPILPPFILIVFFAVIGSCFGSFGNVLMERLPAGASLGGRSYCVGCKKTLRMWKLVPVLSWCFLGGRCARCNAAIPLRYTLVEFVTALIFISALLLSRFDVSAALLLGIAFWAMLLIVVIDLETQLIPDALTLTLAVAAVVLQWTQVGTISLLPALIGFMFLGVQWLVSKGRWIGSGDVLLVAALGLLLLSWQMMVMMLWFTYVVGTLWIGVLYLSRKLNLGAHIAFGPFLILGALLTLLFGERIMVMLF